MAWSMFSGGFGGSGADQAIWKQASGFFWRGIVEWWDRPSCALRERGFEDIVTASRAELDLRDPRAVADFMESRRPKCVILAAAKVGGINANRKCRAVPV